MFEKQKFTEADACKAQVHCQTCRNPGEDGQRWRNSLRVAFNIPEINFTCPHGKKWKGKLSRIVVPNNKIITPNIDAQIAIAAKNQKKGCKGCTRKIGK